MPLKNTRHGSWDKDSTKSREVDQTHSSVIRFESLRDLCAIAAREDLEFDIEKAYLNATLSEDVYMEQPQGFKVAGKEDCVCKSNRALYGTMQAGYRVRVVEGVRWNVQQHGFHPVQSGRVCAYPKFRW